MPSKSPAKKRLMKVAAHNRDFAKRVGVPMSVAKKFVRADKAKAAKRRRK